MGLAQEKVRCPWLCLSLGLSCRDLCLLLNQWALIHLSARMLNELVPF